MIVLLTIFYIVFKSVVMQGKVSFSFVLLSVLLIYKMVLFSEHCFWKGSQKFEMTKEEQCTSLFCFVCLNSTCSLHGPLLDWNFERRHCRSTTLPNMYMAFQCFGTGIGDQLEKHRKKRDLQDAGLSLALTGPIQLWYKGWGTNTWQSCAVQQRPDEGLISPTDHMVLLALWCPCRHCALSVQSVLISSSSVGK